MGSHLSACANSASFIATSCVVSINSPCLVLRVLAAVSQGYCPWVWIYGVSCPEQQPQEEQVGEQATASQALRWLSRWSWWPLYTLTARIMLADQWGENGRRERYTSNKQL